MVIGELIRDISHMLGDNAEFEAREIVMHAAGMSLTEIVLNKNRTADKAAAEMARLLAKRRASGEPLQYIIGTAEFMGLTFKVNRHTLIPRQDTETLVESVIREANEGADILDIGCGSGCIGISLAKFIKNASVTMADISEGALDTARENAARNNVAAKFIKTDILKEIPDGKFDIVVSNPPYIRSEVIETLDDGVRLYEPRTALDGGEDGLIFYRRITRIARSILKDNGLLAFEIGYDQGRAVSEAVSERFGNIRIIKDYCGNDRVITAR